MSKILQVFYVIFSSVLLSLAIPNELYHFGVPFFAFLSLIPLYCVYKNFKSYLQAGILCGLQTMIVHIISSYWLAFFKDFAVLTLGASALGTGLEGFLMGLVLYAPFSRFNKKELYFHSSPLYSIFITFRIFWFCAAYIFYEWIKSCGFLGYPWAVIAGTMYNFKIFMQIAQITGVYGITFLVCFFAGIITEGEIFIRKICLDRYNMHNAKSFLYTVVFFSFLFASTLIFGSIKYFFPEKPIKYLNAILVQQNADPWQQASDDETIELSQKLTNEKLQEAKEKGENVDLIVWSEGCLKFNFPNSSYHYERFPRSEPLLPYIRKTGIPFLLGSGYIERYQPRKSKNAALVFNKEAELTGYYGKMHLVPLAEVIPFAEIPQVAEFLRKVINISAGWTPGDQYVYFEIPINSIKDDKYSPSKIVSLAPKSSLDTRQTVRISTPICFDDAFPDVCRPLMLYGSEVFMNITDDSWSKTKSSEYQHFVISSYRTIEYRTSMARSTNSGYSVVLDVNGNILYDMPLFEECAMFVKIPVYKTKITTYLFFGNWVPYLQVLFIFAISFYLLKTRHEALEPPSERKKIKKWAKKQKKLPFLIQW